MRDIKRISKTLAVLESIWESYPDLRFNQLIHHLEHEYANQHPEFKKVVVEKEITSTIKPPYEHYMIDLFYVEDDEWLEFLIDFKEKL